MRRGGVEDAAFATLAAIDAALGASTGEPLPGFTGVGSLASRFPVSGLAAGSVAAAAQAAAGLIQARHGVAPSVVVDRRLASFWFHVAIRPQGWELPPSRDPIAGDYQAADGWVRLHTNAPYHCAAALEVLGVDAAVPAVAEAVRRWPGQALEDAVVGQGGCAALMRDQGAWADHPQGRAVLAEPLVHDAPGLRGGTPAWDVPAGRPLDGVRVLDMTRVLAGPIATRFLAGLGAEVLRIDPPTWDEPGNVPDTTRGKLCARLDLRRPDDRARWEALLRGADVLVHGYRPGALEGLGLDAGYRQQVRPGLVDVSLDAYGWSGPWAGRRGFDSLVQMSSGIAGIGVSGRPAPLPVQALDHATGYILAAAALRGLATRLATGEGCIRRASLARTAALLVALPDEAGGLLAEETEGDLVPGLYQTPWGAARSLAAPCHLDGAPLRWDAPPAILGSARAEWRT